MAGSAKRELEPGVLGCAFSYTWYKYAYYTVCITHGNMHRIDNRNIHNFRLEITKCMEVICEFFTKKPWERSWECTAI